MLLAKIFSKFNNLTKVLLGKKLVGAGAIVLAFTILSSQALAATARVVTNLADVGRSSPEYAGSLRGVLDAINLGAGDTFGVSVPPGNIVNLGSNLEVARGKNIDYSSNTNSWLLVGLNNYRFYSNDRFTNGRNVVLGNAGTYTGSLLTAYNRAVEIVANSPSSTLIGGNTTFLGYVGTVGGNFNRSNINLYTNLDSQSLSFLGGGAYIQRAGTVNAIFDSNSATTSSVYGSAHARGAGLYVQDQLSSFTGTASNNKLSAQSSGRDLSLARGFVFAFGGGAYFNNASNITGTFNGNTVEAKSTTNSASAVGGGFYSNSRSNFASPIIVNSNIQNNSVSSSVVDSPYSNALGGGAYFKKEPDLVIPGGGNMDVLITGGTISGNSAKASGGARAFASGGGVHFSTSSTSATATLSAVGRDIYFGQNTVEVNGNVRNNDISFGRDKIDDITMGSGVLNVQGSRNGNHSISIIGGVDANITSNNHFVMNRFIATGEVNNNFFWGGSNTFVSQGPSSYSTLNLTSGNTILRDDYVLNSSKDNFMLNLNLGSNHNLMLAFSSRRGIMPVFDLNTSSEHRFAVANGSAIKAPVTMNRAAGGRYLLVNDMNDVSQRLNLSLEQSKHFRSTYHLVGNQLWLSQIWSPYSVINFSDNTERSFQSGALGQWLSNSNGGLRLTADETARLFADINSVTPEAAMTVGIIGQKVHHLATEQAIRQNSSLLERDRKFSTANLSAQYLDFQHKASNEAKFSEPLVQNFASAHKDEGASKVSKLMQAASMNLNSLGNNLSSMNSNAFLDANSTNNLYGIKLWSGYFGSVGNKKRHQGYYGYDSDTNGILVGLNYQLSSYLTLGAYSGYSHTNYDFNGIRAKGDADTFHGGFISELAIDDLKLTTDVAYSHSKNELKRNPGKLGQSKGKFDQDILSVGAELSYGINYYDKGYLTPFVGLKQTWFNQESFEESGRIMPAAVGRVEAQNLTASFGLRAEHEFDLSNDVSIKPNANVSLERRDNDRRLDANTHFLNLRDGEDSLSYNVKSAKSGYESLKAGLGLDINVETSDSTYLGLKFGYDVVKETKTTEHNFYGGIEFNF